MPVRNHIPDDSGQARFRVPHSMAAGPAFGCSQPGRVVIVDAGIISRPELSQGQLNLIARKMGVFSGKTFVDVGCGNGEWLSSLHARGLKVSGMEEKGRTTAAASDWLHLGSPGAAVPWEAHTQDTVLFRGTSLFDAKEFSPELMIGLANLGSSLKPHGRLIIPVQSQSPQDLEQELTRWKNQLSVFPGTFRSRLLTNGLMGYLTLAFLFGGNHQISIIEFQVYRKVESRLTWHRLAREAVMAHMQSNAVA